MVEISSSHRRDFETMFEGLNEGKTMSEIFYYEPSIGKQLVWPCFAAIT